MNEHLATVLIAIVTGIFSIITLKIKKSGEKLNDTIDEQTIFLEKEKKIREIIMYAEKDRDSVSEQINLFLLKVVSFLLLHMEHSVEDKEFVVSLGNISAELEKNFREASAKLKKVYEEHHALMTVINSLQEDINDSYKKRESSKDHSN